MSKSYTITYQPQNMSGTNGYWFSINVRGREVIAGWEPGAKRRAESAAREAIKARDTLRTIASWAA